MNGSQIAHIKADTDENIHGVVDLHGASTKVSIVGKMYLELIYRQCKHKVTVVMTIATLMILLLYIDELNDM